MSDELKLLDTKKDSKVVMRAVLLVRISLAEKQGPLLDVENLVTKVAELEMTVIFSEIINAVFRENGFDEVKSIAQCHHRDILLHDQTHWPLKL